MFDIKCKRRNLLIGISLWGSIFLRCVIVNSRVGVFCFNLVSGLPDEHFDIGFAGYFPYHVNMHGLYRQYNVTPILKINLF